MGKDIPELGYCQTCRRHDVPLFAPHMCGNCCNGDIPQQLKCSECEAHFPQNEIQRDENNELVCDSCRKSYCAGCDQYAPGHLNANNEFVCDACHQ